MAQVGDFCPNPDCPDHGKLQSEQQRNIILFEKTKAGRQRRKCKSCNGTFVETKGTIFYRRHTPEDEIIETLALSLYLILAGQQRGANHKAERLRQCSVASIAG